MCVSVCERLVQLCDAASVYRRTAAAAGGAGRDPAFHSEAPIGCGLLGQDNQGAQMWDEPQRHSSRFV